MRTPPFHPTRRDAIASLTSATLIPPTHSVIQDGDAYIALSGPDPVLGHMGAGSTPELALVDLQRDIQAGPRPTLEQALAGVQSRR